MLEPIQHLDETILFLINHFRPNGLPEFMFFSSQKWAGIPFYAVFLWVLFRSFSFKKFLWVVLLALVSIGLSDFLASGVCKPLFKRERPSHNSQIENKLIYVNDYRGGQHGFVSSHASNTFSLWFFSFLLAKYLKPKTRWVVHLLLFWAILTSLSRVYLAVHYPSDVFFGGLLGILVAFFVFFGFKIKWKLN